MCNQEVKFKLFLEAALQDGADMIATGHYARVYNAANPKSQAPNSKQDHAELHAGVDPNKDQSYFLCRVTEEALSRTLMPIGELTKPEVRKLARKYGLATAEKKDSQGICFVGKVGIKDFLQQFVDTQPGNIIDQKGQIVGQHDGALFYTIGQRQGLGVGGGLPYYVIGKDMDKNKVYVTNDLQDARLWDNEITLTSTHWINGRPNLNSTYGVRTRYRAELLTVSSLNKLDNDNWHIVLHDEVRALTPGQSAVLYQNDQLVGSGIVI
jgi:tRNA-specific 2-thiouridylase